MMRELAFLKEGVDTEEASYSEVDPWAAAAGRGGVVSGRTVGKIYRGLGVSEASFYRWRSECEGLKLDQARRLKIWSVRTRGLLGRIGVTTLFIESGSPSKNGSNEPFNGKLRDELLARQIFYSRPEAHVLNERWRRHYNTARPQTSLNGLAPVAFATRPASAQMENRLCSSTTAFRRQGQRYRRRHRGSSVSRRGRRS